MLYKDRVDCLNSIGSGDWHRNAAEYTTAFGGIACAYQTANGIVFEFATQAGSSLSPTFTYDPGTPCQRSLHCIKSIYNLLTVSSSFLT